MLSYEFQKLNRLVRSLLPIRRHMRWRECAAWVSFPTAPQAVVRTFNAHKYPFIRDVRHIQRSGARFFHQALSPEIKGRSASGRPIIAVVRRFSPGKVRDFYFYRTPVEVQTPSTLIPLLPVLPWPMFFISELPICRTDSPPFSVSLGFIYANGLNPPLSSRRVARGREVNHVPYEGTFNPARRLEKF